MQLHSSYPSTTTPFNPLPIRNLLVSNPLSDLENTATIPPSPPDPTPPLPPYSILPVVLPPRPPSPPLPPRTSSIALSPYRMYVAKIRIMPAPDPPCPPPPPA